MQKDLKSVDGAISVELTQETAKKPYVAPTLIRYNDIIVNTHSGFGVQGPPGGGPTGGAQSSPTVPAATVF